MCTDERCRHSWTCDCIEQCARRPDRDVTALAALYVRFEAFIGWKLPSADEALLREDLDAMTRAWLEQFVEEWDEATKWERRCSEEAQPTADCARCGLSLREGEGHDCEADREEEKREILRHELGEEIAARGGLDD